MTYNNFPSEKDPLHYGEGYKTRPQEGGKRPSRIVKRLLFVFVLEGVRARSNANRLDAGLYALLGPWNASRWQRRGLVLCSDSCLQPSVNTLRWFRSFHKKSGALDR